MNLLAKQSIAAAAFLQKIVAPASLALVLAASAAHADPITFDFTGALDSGGTFDGRYTFDSDAQDFAPSANTGRYLSVGPDFAFVLNVGGSSFRIDQTQVGVDQGGLGGVDEYGVSAFGDNGTFFGLQLVFADHVFADDGELLTPPSLSSVTVSRFLVSGFGFAGIDSIGTITSLTCATCNGGGPPQTSVPEPATFGLFALGMVPALLLTRRRKRPASARLSLMASRPSSKRRTFFPSWRRYGRLLVRPGTDCHLSSAASWRLSDSLASCTRAPRNTASNERFPSWHADSYICSVERRKLFSPLQGRV